MLHHIRPNLVLSALKWLSGIWEPFFVQFHRTVVAPNELEI